MFEIPASISHFVNFTAKILGVLLLATILHGVMARMYGNVCGFGPHEAMSSYGWIWLILGHTSPWCPVFLQSVTVLGTFMTYAWHGAFGLVTLSVFRVATRAVQLFPIQPAQTKYPHPEAIGGVK